MLTRKSGILALVIGAAVLGACEQKAPIVNITTPTPPVSVTITGAPTAPIKKGASVQLIAVVNNSTNQAVTWSLASGTGVVTVSAAGLVTAVAPGTATVKAVSAADATASAAVTIQVADTTTGGGGTTVGQPSITIQSVTTNAGGLNAPVNPAAVAGPIDVTLNVDIPAGVTASAVRTTLDGTEVCRQAFSASGSTDAAVEGAQVPQTIVCSINTAAFNATTGVATFANGTHTLKAEVLNAAGTSIASATYQPLIFANLDVVRATVTTTKGPVTAASGLSWRGGDVTVSLLPTVYTGAPNAVSSLTVSLQPSVNASIQGGPASCSIITAPVACAVGAKALTDATAADGFSVTFPAATNWSAGTGVGNLEDPNVTLAIAGLTTGGNTYAGGTIVTYNGTAISAVNPLRLDNLAPRVTLLDITPATLGCAPSTSCYVNGSYTFANGLGAGSKPATVDFGSDSQTTTFAAGVAGGSFTQATNGSTLAETPVAQTYLLQVTTTDLLGNSRTVYATDKTDCVTSSQTSVAAANLTGACAVAPTAVQTFGVDLTPPTVTVTGGPANNSTNAGAAYTVSFSDAGVGPSGFSATPVLVKVERITAAGTTCYNQAGTVVVSCTTGGGFTSGSGAVTLNGAQGYYRVTWQSVDQAGNPSTAVTRVTLIDTTAPVVGGIVAPSTIAGGSSPSFTATTTDNIDLGDVKAALDYGVGTYVLGFPSQTIDTYGFDSFTTSTNTTYTIANIITSIEGTTGAGRPNGVYANADQVEFDVRDVAGVATGVACVFPVVVANCASTQQSLVANITPNATSWATINPTFASGNVLHGNFLQSAPSNATVCDGPTGAACLSTSKTSTVLSATVTGPNTTFGDPFQRVLFFYQDTAGRYQLIGQGSIAITDNTVTSTRTITYSITWTPGAIGVGAHNVIAVGTDAAGHGLATNTQVVTISDT